MSQLALAPQLASAAIASSPKPVPLSQQANSQYEDPPSTELSGPADHFGSAPSSLKQAPQVQSGFCCIPFLGVAAAGIATAVGVVGVLCAKACACCCALVGIPVAGLATYNFLKK